MNPLFGTWQQPEGQAYAGLVFSFKEDGTFESTYAAMGITSSGTYLVKDDLIYLDQNKHSLGLVGKFEGRYLLENETLRLGFGNPGEKAPEDTAKARIYLRVKGEE